MKYLLKKLFVGLGVLVAPGLMAQQATPIMGWSSWNTYRVHISDSLIRKQADAMVAQGLKEVGYTYINIDDGFFGYRDAEGKLMYASATIPGWNEGNCRLYPFKGTEGWYLFGCGQEYVWFHVGSGCEWCRSGPLWT